MRPIPSERVIGFTYIAALCCVAVIALGGCYATELRSATEPAGHSSFLVLDRGQLDFRTSTIDTPPLRPFFFAPVERHRAGPEDKSIQVQPTHTPWGEAWNHDQLCRNMNDILRANGVVSKNARVRMTAHAIVASGWRQSVWNHNAWGVKRGSWKGPWFEMGTTEVDHIGFDKVIFDAAWRSFANWGEAIADYRARITRDSRRPSYRKAARNLTDKSNRADTAFWRSLGEGNYYTTQSFTADNYAALCFRIRQTVSDS